MKGQLSRTIVSSVVINFRNYAKPSTVIRLYIRDVNVLSFKEYYPSTN